MTWTQTFPSHINRRYQRTHNPHTTNTSCTIALSGAIPLSDVPSSTAYCVVSCNTHTHPHTVKPDGKTLHSEEEIGAETRLKACSSTVSGARRHSSESLAGARRTFSRLRKHTVDTQSTSRHTAGSPSHVMRSQQRLDRQFPMNTPLWSAEGRQLTARDSGPAQLPWRLRVVVSLERESRACTTGTGSHVAAAPRSVLMKDRISLPRQSAWGASAAVAWTFRQRLSAHVRSRQLEQATW